MASRAGLEAFEKRREEKSSIYSYEQKDGGRVLARTSNANSARAPKPGRFFQAQARLVPAEPPPWLVIRRENGKTPRPQAGWPVSLRLREEGRTIRSLTPGKPKNEPPRRFSLGQ